MNGSKSGDPTKQYGRPDRTDRKNLAESFPGLVSLALRQQPNCDRNFRVARHSLTFGMEEGTEAVIPDREFGLV